MSWTHPGGQRCESHKYLQSRPRLPSPPKQGLPKLPLGRVRRRMDAGQAANTGHHISEEVAEEGWHPSMLDLEFPAREVHALQSKGQNHRSEKGHD